MQCTGFKNGAVNWKSGIGPFSIVYAHSRYTPAHSLLSSLLSTCCVVPPPPLLTPTSYCLPLHNDQFLLTPIHISRLFIHHIDNITYLKVFLNMWSLFQVPGLVCDEIKCIFRTLSCIVGWIFIYCFCLYCSTLHLSAISTWFTVKAVNLQPIIPRIIRQPCPGRDVLFFQPRLSLP